MIELALRARQHRVVVSHDHATRVGVVEHFAVHPAHPRDQAICGRPVDQLFHRIPLTPGCDHQRSIFNEGAGVDQVIDVLAGSSLAGATPARHGLGTSFILGSGLAIKNFRKIWADVLKIER